MPVIWCVYATNRDRNLSDYQGDFCIVCYTNYTTPPSFVLASFRFIDRRFCNNGYNSSHVIGTIIQKSFDDGKFYEGEVTKFDPPNKSYTAYVWISRRQIVTGRNIFMTKSQPSYCKKTQWYSCTHTLKVRSLALHTSIFFGSPLPLSIPTPRKIQIWRHLADQNVHLPALSTLSPTMWRAQ